MEEKVEDIEEEVEVEKVKKQSEAEVEVEAEAEVEDKNYINIMYGSRHITDNNTQ